MCKNTNYSSWNPKIDNLMVIDLIIMTTCMSPFSKLFVDFDSMPKFSILTNMWFCKFALLYDVISFSKWFKYFTIQKIWSSKNPLQETKMLQGIIITLWLISSFNESQNIIFQISSYKNRPIIYYLGAKTP